MRRESLSFQSEDQPMLLGSVGEKEEELENFVYDDQQELTDHNSGYSTRCHGIELLLYIRFLPQTVQTWGH